MEPDKAYIYQRNKLIPAAEEYANKRFGKVAPKGQKNIEKYAADWSRCFHRRMNLLWEEREQ